MEDISREEKHRQELEYKLYGYDKDGVAYKYGRFFDTEEETLFQYSVRCVYRIIFKNGKVRGVEYLRKI